MSVFTGNTIEEGLEMNYRIRYIAIGLLFFTLLASVTVAQQTEIFVCDDCQQENMVANKFCVNCGETLSEEYARWQADVKSRELQLERFISERIDPPRIFTVPTARVLRSMDVRLTGGGAFGVAADRSFLGTVGIGLGDIAEVEFSTVRMMTNITRGSSVFPTSAFKLMLIPENRWHIPTLAIAFRNSANWSDVQSDRKVLEADLYDVGFAAKGITSIGYETRFTTMYGVTSVRLWSMNIHAGLSLTDVRVQDLAIRSYLDEDYTNPKEKQKNLIGGFFGIDVESNPQTKLMLEIRTISNHEYNVETKEIDVSEAYLAIGGVRFFFNRWISTDVGVWYQSTFRGIADLQIKLGLNLFIPGGSLSEKVRQLSPSKGSSRL
ncbi:MAG: hypothetical protein JSW54_03035 [Fidelibacterota bacterium]|nr:MAG: hypothetical protein JSW54_03035 [Candidatus Neomarinimicrobiota bacterium]